MKRLLAFVFGLVIMWVIMSASLGAAKLAAILIVVNLVGFLIIMTMFAFHDDEAERERLKAYDLEIHKQTKIDQQIKKQVELAKAISKLRTI